MAESYDPDYCVCLSDSANYWVGPVRDIVALELNGNYCKFTIITGQKLNVRGSLSRWEKKLPPSLFFRANRDSIVNLSRIKLMEAFDLKRFVFIMVADVKVILSRQQSVLFRRSRSL